MIILYKRIETLSRAFSGSRGRRAASATGFYYSPALIAAGQDGMSWDEGSIDRLLADPDGFLEGRHRMRYAPIDDPQTRAAVIAALRSATR
jgi:cytochrome c